MKYTDDEAFASVLEKGKEIKRKRAQRKTGLLSGVSCMLIALLTATVVLLPDKGAEAPLGTVYGSFLLSLEAGGYVLVGVLAFALGTAFTLLCIQLRKQKKMQKPQEEETKNTED